MSSRAIAHRLGVSEKAICKLVGASRPAEDAQLAFAAMTRPLATPVSSAKSSGDADSTTRLAEDRASDRDPITALGDNSEPVPMSLDRDASDRRPSIGNSPIWGCSMMQHHFFVTDPRFSLWVSS
jgi:hypothetical protein